MPSLVTTAKDSASWWVKVADFLSSHPGLVPLVCIGIAIATFLVKRADKPPHMPPPLGPSRPTEEWSLTIAPPTAERYRERRSKLFDACREEVANRIAFTNLNPKMFVGVRSGQDTRNWLRQSEVFMKAEKYLPIRDLPDGTITEQLNWLADLINDADPDEKLP